MQKEIKQYILDNIIVDPKTKCWNWQGTFTYNGYPVSYLHYGNSQVRRMAVTNFKGKDLTGKQLLSTCKNKNCVNPDHFIDRIKKPKQYVMRRQKPASEILPDMTKFRPDRMFIKDHIAGVAELGLPVSSREKSNCSLTLRRLFSSRRR